MDPSSHWKIRNIKMFFLHTFTMRSASRVVFSPSNIILILQQFSAPHLHLHGIMIQFWKLQVFRPLWDAEKGKGCLKIFWINIFNMFGSVVADFERFVFFAERHLINHSGLCRILVTPKMSVQSIQVEFITNLSAVCHKFINLNSTTMRKITKRTTSVNYWNLFVTEQPCTRNTFFVS